jgi:hypothetical protein
MVRLLASAATITTEKIHHMNATHLHLILNHIPVLGCAFGLGLLVLGFWRKSDELKKASLLVFVIVAALSIPAYLTGEPAEGGVKGLPGVSGAIIEKHEEAAGVALTGTLILGVSALASLVWFRAGKLLPAWLSLAFLAISLAVSGVAAWTANLGGQVRHTEIRSGASASNSADRNHD